MGRPIPLPLSLTVPPPYTTRYTASITAVSYWTGSGFSAPSTTCPGTSVPQQITIQVAPVTSGNAAESIVLNVQGTGQINLAPPVQLGPPTGVSATSSPTVNGAIVVNFTPPSSPSPPVGQTYTAIACSNYAMTAGCESDPSYTSGSTFSGLTPGAEYWVEVTANGSPGYLGATSSVFPSSANPSTPLYAQGNSDAPTVTGVSPSTTTVGALVVTYNTSSVAPSGTTYFAKACTDQAMTANCVTTGTFTSGGEVTGLTPGTAYYVTVTANASGTYPVSPSVVFPAANATVQLTAPQITSATSTPTGALSVTYTGSSNAPTTGQTYTETQCTDSGMSQNCSSESGGSQVNGLTVGTNYWVQIVANASSGYLSAPSATSGPIEITVQLDDPTIGSVGQGSHSGSVKVKFTGSANATPTTSYTCTVYLDNGGSVGAEVTQLAGCTPGNSGNTISGLASGTTVFVKVTASDSNGYLSATSAAVSGPVK